MHVRANYLCPLEFRKPNWRHNILSTSVFISILHMDVENDEILLKGNALAWAPAYETFAFLLPLGPGVISSISAE